MADYKIRVKTDLDISEAKSKLESLGKDKKIKVPVDVQVKSGQIEKSVKEAFKRGSKSVGKNTSAEIEKTLSNEAKVYLNHAKKIADLRNKLDENLSKKQRQGYKNEIKETEKHMQNMRKVVDKENKELISAMNSIDKNILKYDVGEGITKQVSKTIKGFNDIRKGLNAIEGDLSKKLVEQAKAFNKNAYNKYNRNSYSRERAEEAKHEIAMGNKTLAQIKEFSKLEKKVLNDRNKLKSLSAKLTNEELIKQNNLGTKTLDKLYNSLNKDGLDPKQATGYMQEYAKATDQLIGKTKQLLEVQKVYNKLEDNKHKISNKNYDKIKDGLNKKVSEGFTSDRDANSYVNSTRRKINEELRAEREYQNQVKKRQSEQRKINLQEQKARTLVDDARNRLSLNKDTISPTLFNQLSGSLDNLTKKAFGLESVQKAIKGINQAMKEGQKAFSQENAMSSGIEKIQKQANKMLDTARTIDGELSGKFSRKFIDDTAKFSKGIENISSSKSLKKALNRSNDNQNYLNKLKRFKSLESSVDSGYVRLQEKMGSISNQVTSKRIDSINSSLKTSYSSLRNLNSLDLANGGLSKFNNELKSASIAVKNLDSIDKGINKLSVAEATLGTKDINRFRRGFTELAMSDSIASPETSKHIKSLKTQVAVATKYQSAIQNFKNDLKGSIIGTSVGFAVGSILRNQVGGIIETYKQIDASMTDVKKVADASDVRTKKQRDAITRWAIETGKQTGKSAAEVQTSLATSIQSGMGDMKSSMAVSKKAMILSNVGDMNVDDATKAINTIVKSFKMTPLEKVIKNVRGVRKETNQISEALDKLNYVG